MADNDNRWLQAAADLLANRQFAAAAQAAEKAERSGAPRAPCLRIRAQALLALGRHSDAQRVLSELVAVDPRDAWALKTLAELHLSAGRPAKALAFLDQAESAHPADADLLRQIAELRQAAALAAAASESAGLPTRRGNLKLLLAVGAVLNLAIIAAVIGWLLLRSQPQRSSAMASRPAAAAQQTTPLQTPVAPQGPSSAVTAAAPRTQPSQRLAATQRTTNPAQPLAETRPSTQPARPLTTAQPRQAPTRPMQEVRPAQKPHLKLLWLRCTPVPQMTVRAEGKIRRVYIMSGEILNDSDVPCDVAVVRGRLLAHGQAAGYGIGEVGQIPPHGRVRFDFYAYQLADENAPPPDNYDAIVIPGFGLSKMLQQLGLPPDLEQVIRSGQVPEF